ncbi:MAG: hypothetical protein ACYDBQ_08855, partial [Thermoplasmatota archaeon]
MSADRYAVEAPRTALSLLVHRRAAAWILVALLGASPLLVAAPAGALLGPTAGVCLLSPVTTTSLSLGNVCPPPACVPGPVCAGAVACATGTANCASTAGGVPPAPTIPCVTAGCPAIPCVTAGCPALPTVPGIPAVPTVPGVNPGAIACTPAQTVTPNCGPNNSVNPGGTLDYWAITCPYPQSGAPTDSIIAAGRFNFDGASQSSITAGLLNVITCNSRASFIGAGANNLVDATYASIVAGNNNTARGSAATIGAGMANVATGPA